MLPKISSTQNPFVKHLVRLRQNHDYREEKRSVVIPGRKLVTEICPGKKAKALFCLNERLLPEFLQADAIYEVTKEVMAKASGMKNPEGLLAEMTLPQEQSLKEAKNILVLDCVADPGNMGTLIRTALALGWDGAFFIHGSCDPFNEKVIRSSMGAVFRFPMRHGTREELLSLASGKQLLCADLQGESPSSISTGEGVVLVLGNESQGLSDGSIRSCRKVAIPMKGTMESLNVAIAGGILMYVLMEGTP